MIKRILLVIISIVLIYLDLTKFALPYVLFVVAFITYGIYKKSYNEISLGIVLFGYSFFGLLTKVFGVPNIVLILLSIATIFGIMFLKKWGEEGKLSIKVNTYVFLLFLYFLTILVSFTKTVFIYDYQSFKMQLFFLWIFIFLFSIHSYTQRFTNFNFEYFITICYLLFIPHFTHLFTDQGETLSPMGYWDKYSVLDMGIRGTKGVDVITPSRYAGLFVMVYLVNILNFSKEKIHTLFYILPALIMLIIVQTRQALVGIAVGSFILIIFQIVKSNSKNRTALFFVALLMIFSFNWYNNYLEKNDVNSRIANESEGSGREKVWKDATEAAQIYSGLGFGNYVIFVGSYEWPHNIFLETYLEIGLLGIVILSIIVIFMLVELLALFKEKDIKQNLIGLFLIIASFYYLTLAQFSADIPRNMMTFFLFSLYLINKKTLKDFQKISKND